jgi:cytochrome b6-f complex iron-sulfur subunit
MKGLRCYVEKLLKGRRPGSFPVSEADVDVLRVAVELRGARPGSSAPREEFVTALHRRLSDEQAGEWAGEQAGEQAEPPPVPDRRRLVLGGTLLATGAAAAGAVVDHVFARRTPQAAGTVTPDQGRWHPVVSSADLPEGAVHPFDSGGIMGFVTRDGGRLRAVSGVCTHQGCRLNLGAGRQLHCPCHQAVFALDGSVVRHRFPTSLSALPRLAVREARGVVQVYVAST